VPLNESPLKDHPLNPMQDSNLVRVLARQSGSKVGLVDLATVGKGPDAIRARLTELAKQGIGAAIIDSVFDPELETIGEVALGHRLSVGASGMGLGLARGLIASGCVKAASAVSGERAIGGSVACLAGSCSQATLSQIAQAEKSMPVLHLDPEKILGSGDEVERALGWAHEYLAKGPVLIASSSTPDQVAALQAKYGRDAAGHAIEQTMAAISEGLVASRRAPAGRRRRRNVGCRGRSARHPGVSGRTGNRRWRSGPALCWLEQGRRGVGAEIRKFRWPGFLQRRHSPDALRISLP
jgi:uncharacterized protein YgbK (DUF1537 family)